MSIGHYFHLLELLQSSYENFLVSYEFLIDNYPEVIEGSTISDDDYEEFSD